MLHQVKSLYEFGVFRLDTGERRLLRDNKPIALTSKVFDILTMLVENSGHLLEKDELMQAIWPDTAVEEGNLTRYVSTLRRALGEGSNGRRYIETVPKRGYRFVADVKVVEADGEELVLRERTCAQVIIHHEQETDDQSEIRAEVEACTKAQGKAPVSRRRRRQALIAVVATIVIMTAAAFWWMTIKTRQAETAAQIRSIAVLPFTQLGEGEKDELVGFGMADVLITRIGSVNRIAVRPTSAVFKYIGAEPDIVSVGKELKVDALVEGSIQRIGERTRVTVRLVRARDGELLWAETFDGRLKDLFAMQDEMSERVAAALSLNADGQKNLLTRQYTKSGEAYHAYIKGRYFWNKRTAGDLKKAIEYFEQAIQIDADYALAFAGLADSYALLGDYGVAPAREVFPKMKVAAARAVEVDDHLAEAHTSLAYAKRLSDWDWPGAEQEFRLAIELNYSYAIAHHWYSEYLAGMARFDEALEEAQRAEDLDPQSLIINTNVGWILYLARRYDEAIHELKKTLEMEPSFFLARNLVWQAYVQKSMYEDALEWGEMSVVPKTPEARERDEILRRAYEKAGWKGFEWKVLELNLEGEKRGAMLAYSIAGGYTTIGDYDAALKWLQKAYENREASMVWVKIDPGFDGLRSHPRFQDLLRRMRLSD
jgi:DNA-binding winged helix-turn-helix (wHTH) protein/TolB-like protein/Tfp pilus assembly protein PilF